MSSPYLEDIYTGPCDVTDDLVLVVEMTAEHLRRLVHGVLDLDSNATTCLRFLHYLWRKRKS
jgi:hypothetical protein